MSVHDPTLTCPTRAALMTGRYQHRVGGLECAIGAGNVGRYHDAVSLRSRNELGLPATETSIGRLLKQAGYAGVKVEPAPPAAKDPGPKPDEEIEAGKKEPSVPEPPKPGAPAEAGKDEPKPEPKPGAKPDEIRVDGKADEKAHDKM